MLGGPDEFKIAVIGGTGFEQFPFKIRHDPLVVKTPFGDIPLEHGAYQGTQIYFLLRHGKDHVAPHEVNYRANAVALYKLGVSAILSSAAVGSLSSSLKPGDFVLIDDFIDMTRGRPQTVLTVPKKTKSHRAAALHVSMSEPYCSVIGGELLAAAKAQSVDVKKGGVYVAVEGPRFESRAEIRAYRTLGGDVVGMTNVPEVVFARELGICYAALGLVTNMAAGLSPSAPSPAEVVSMMDAKSETIRAVFRAAADRLIQNPQTILTHKHS